ncbi:hypothetical protein [Leeuwenhoekiella sp. ZYFB001]|uniref:hypothetical protein n=1 Tax=Leeuwenhoekiella sp. ZYFB001 TaxID=2719912 RepID=UPI0014304A7D|nr:hypothetical protein [Leeuwenhoekiella sp. ZYFB001]
MVLKLKTVTDNPGVYKDCWIESDHIIGFCWTSSEELEEGECINLFFTGDTITVKNEKHLQDFLMERFVERAIKAK